MPNKRNGEYKIQNSDQLHELVKFNEISCIQNKSKCIKSINESSINFPVDLSNEEFIRFLDSSFKPEINLSNNDTKDCLFFNIQTKITKIDLLEVNLCYIGNKNMHQKGKHCERTDVVLKTFIRTTRRYLWELFESQFDTSDLVCNKPSELFKEKVLSFYSKYFKRFEGDEIGNNEDLQYDITSLLGIILTNKYSFPNKNFKERKMINLFKSIHKSYSKELYQQLFSMKQVIELYRMIREAGILENMINAYPVILVSKDIYLNIERYIEEGRVDKVLTNKSSML